jgi:hypothetical protein
MRAKEHRAGSRSSRLAEDAAVRRPVHLDVSQLADHVLRAKGSDLDDRPLRTTITYRIVQALSMQEKRGAVVGAGRIGNVRLWALRH